MAKIPESTIRRLSLYLRFLEAFDGEGARTVSSQALAERGGTTSAQVRKDLSLFGSFGKRGLGYSVPDLAVKLREILGIGVPRRVVVIGVGKIGMALVQYAGLAARGFTLERAYDVDPQVVGRRVASIVVRHADELEGDLRRDPVDVAIIATPPGAAQETANRVGPSVRGILNFAPVTISAPEGVAVRHVNVELELEALGYALRTG